MYYFCDNGCDPLKTKIIAAIVIVIIVVAALGVGGFFLFKNNDKNNEINVIAAVNTEGSGIYIKSSIDKNTMFDFSTPIPTPKASGWVGKIFGTPGAATIQHVQLLQLINGMGLKAASYNVNTYNPNTTDTVYLYTGISNATLALGNNVLDGGSLWQPQYQIIVDAPSHTFKPLVLTNDIFPGHSCCVIAGNNGYLKSNEDKVVRFLAAYVHAVNWVNNALDEGKTDPTNADYVRLIDIAMDAVNANAPGSIITKAEIEEALYTVTYTDGGNLSELTTNVANLSEQMVQLNQTSGIQLSDLGFASGQKFAEKFVTNTYLAKAIELEAKGPQQTSRTDSISVAVISGDLHQLAIHVAKSLGFFEEYGLNVTLNGAPNGPGVATAIQNGNSSLGLLGAPPITITVISGKLVTSDSP